MPGPSPQRAALVHRLIALLSGLIDRAARLMPREFRDTHGRAMMAATSDMVANASRQSAWRAVPLLGASLLGLLVRLSREHAAEAAIDIRYAWRQQIASPMFTLAAIVSLAVGISVAVSVYAQLRSMVFSQVPGVADAETLVTISSRIAYPHLSTLAGDGDPCVQVTGYVAPVALLVADGRGGAPERVWGHAALHGYFSTLGVTPQRGRLPAWDASGAESSMVVISDRYWRRRFGGRHDIVGAPRTLNGQPVTVAGVLPARFIGAAPIRAAADVWVSALAGPSLLPDVPAAVASDERTEIFHLLARVRGEGSLDDVAARWDAQLHRLRLDAALAEPDSRSPALRALPAGRVLPMTPRERWVFAGAPLVMAALMLWVACASVAILLVARTADRRKELGIRLALGASDGRLMRQILTEVLMVALPAGLLGYALARWSHSTTEWVTPMLPEHVQLDLALGADSALVCVLVTAAAAAMLGLPAVWQARRATAASSLGRGEHRSLEPHRWSSQRNMLVLQQVAGSIMLVLVTGMVALGFQRVARGGDRPDVDRLYSVHVDPRREGRTPEEAARLLDRVADRLARVPGVEGVARTDTSLFGLGRERPSRSIRVSTEDGSPAIRHVGVAGVGPELFATTGMRVLEGRTLRPSDRQAGTPVVVVNRALALQAWGDGPAVGRWLELDGRRADVVGVVEDIEAASFLDRPMPTVFVPAGDTLPASRLGASLVVRVAAMPGAAPWLRDQLAGLEPGVSVLGVSRLSDDLAQAVYFADLTAVLYGGMGALGLLLAVVGLTGVTAYAALRRRRELAIRLALGAGRGHVVGLVLSESAWLAAAGTLIGIAGAIATTRLLAGYFDHLATATATTITDPALVVGLPLALAVLSLLASAGPGRRVLAIDPQQCLRAE
jgi:predicted permease